MNNRLKNLLLFAAFVFLSLAAADWILGKIVLSPSFFAAKRQGMDWDTRTRLDVILDNRKSDPNWFPAVPSNTFLNKTLKLNGQRILPLGGVANTNAVGCNENGYWIVLHTDAAGFRNPRGTWPLQDEKYLYLVGDSYAAGACVQEEDNVAARLRKHFYRVVNLGVDGNGPLHELASIREYVVADKVSYVFWMYYEGNDLRDLLRDRRSPILMRYLDPGFSQDLWARQKSVNAKLRAYTENRVNEKAKAEAIFLRHLRRLLWQIRYGESAFRRGDADSPQPADIQLFEAVLKRAKSEVGSKGGSLVLVYLPDYYRFSGGPVSHWASYGDEIKGVAISLGIPIIDMEPVFGSRTDPLEMFPFRLYGHYSAEGYAQVSQSILEFLSKRRIEGP